MLLGVMLALLQGPMVGPPMPEGPGVLPAGVVSAGPLQGGPMVYGPGERGRLVVACDMTSDTCSDGRKIVTSSATDRPCEKERGVWSYVGPNEACFNWRGELESWGPATTYLSYGANLDKGDWRRSGRGGSLEPLSDGWRVHNDPETASSGWIQPQPNYEEGEIRTSSCLVRSTSGVTVGIGPHGIPSSIPETYLPASPDWTVFGSSFKTPSGTTQGYTVIYPGGRTLGAASVDVKACWTTKTNTPGRPCWADEEAPVTCDGESHNLSTVGWPATGGSFSLRVRFEEFSESYSIILDARSSSSAGFNLHYDRAAGRLVHRQGVRLLFGPTVETGRDYFLELRRDGPRVEMRLDGELVASADDWPTWVYFETAAIGKHFQSSSNLNLKGSISNLTVRSFK